MKQVWLTAVVASALLLGVVMATEEEQDHLQSIDSRTFNLTAGTLPTTTDPLLILGNIFAFLNNLGTGLGNDVIPPITINLTNPDFLGLTDGLGLDAGVPLDLAALFNGGTAAGLGGAAAGLTGVAALVWAGLAALGSLKNALLYIPLKGLEIANFILAIIGLAFLGIFLAGGGDVGGLVGLDTSDFDFTGFLRRDSSYIDTYTTYAAATARSLMESSYLQDIAQFAYDAVMRFSQ